MSGKETSVELKRVVASATEVGLQLRKAIDARQLYVPGHPTAVQMISAAHVRLSSHLAAFGPLELAITSLAIMIQDKPIIVAERREESLSHALFLEGVRGLTFLPDIPIEEFESLLDLWHSAITPGEDTGQTFATRFWEAGLKHVRIETVETLVDGAVEAAEVEALSQGLLAGHLPIRSVPAGALVDAAVFADVTVPTIEAGESPVALSDVELEHFQGELDSQSHAESERTLAVLTQLALTTTAERRTRVDVAICGIFAALGRHKRFAEIARIANHVAQARRALPADAPQAVLFTWMLEQIASPDLVAEALESINSPQLGDAAAKALSYVPGLSAGTLIDALANAPDAVVRERLMGIIVNVLPNGELIERRIAEASQENAEALLRIAMTLPPAERTRVQLKALSHPSAQLRRTALDALKTADVVANASRVRPLIRDGDPAVRRSALNVLVRARDHDAPQLIGGRLSDPALEPAERKVLYQALGTLSSDAANAVLRREFVARTEPELKAACALAIARAGDDLARPILEAAAKKLFGPTEVKEACKTALKRLDAIKVSPAAKPAPAHEEEP